MLENGGVAVNKSVGYNSHTYRVAYMLPDGAVISFLLNWGEADNNYYRTILIVDVNGKKAPNRWGICDVFRLNFTRHNSGKIRLSDEYSSLSEKGGSLPRNILLNKWSNDFDTILWE